MIEVDAECMSDDFFRSLPSEMEATFVRYMGKTAQDSDMVYINISYNDYFMRGKCYGNTEEKWLRCIPKGTKILVGRVRPNKSQGFDDEIECRSFSFSRQPFETQAIVQAFYASQNQDETAPLPSDGLRREQLSMFSQAHDAPLPSLPDAAVLSPVPTSAAPVAVATAPAPAPIELPAKFRGPRSKVSITLTEEQVDGLLATSFPGETIQEVMRRSIDAWIQLSWKRA